MFSFKPITNTEVAILDQSGQNTQHIRNQLAAYKSRWNESLADKLIIINSISELPDGIPVIAPSFVNIALHHNTYIVPSISQMTHYDLRAATIKPKVNLIWN